MTVWTLEFFYDYEGGGSLVSVHSTREGAQAAAQVSVRVPLEWRKDNTEERWKARNPGRNVSDLPGDLTFEVSEWTVNEC